ncbi:hypothetical protein FG379_001332, partial [Cryptosporidium bovis]|uniref:uncharacterized protein n=1 Tax=Cryptosporidium bovis TaxID=310047 RepID=UPI00351A87A1
SQQSDNDDDKGSSSESQQSDNDDDKGSSSESQQSDNDDDKGSSSGNQHENNPFDKVIMSLRRVETPERILEREETERHMKRFKNFDEDYMNKCKKKFCDLKAQIETRIKTEEEKKVESKEENELPENEKKRKEKLERLSKECIPKEKINYEDVKKTLKKVSRQ